MCLDNTPPLPSELPSSLVRYPSTRPTVAERVASDDEGTGIFRRY